MTIIAFCDNILAVSQIVISKKSIKGEMNMKELERLTASYVIEQLSVAVAESRQITKSLARKLVLNALTYNLVINEINSQIDYLME